VQERGWRKDGRKRVRVIVEGRGREVEGWKLLSTAPLL
jgi:hypothetical protein